MSYVINFLGSGIRYWICELPIAQFKEMEQIRIKHHVDWVDLLFDFNFLQHFGYQHWNELAILPAQMGFLITAQNKIEIKKGSKFLSKFFASDLLNQSALFPLYQTSSSLIKLLKQEQKQQLILLQIEKGLIAKLKVNDERLEMEDLCFELCSMQDLSFISSIDYKGSKLLIKQDDTVSISSRVYLLNESQT